MMVLNVSPNHARFYYNGFFNEFQFNNVGTINVAAAVDSLSFMTKLVSTGDINMGGDTKLSIGVLDLSGSISGPIGSSLHLIGLIYNTGSFAKWISRKCNFISD